MLRLLDQPDGDDARRLQDALRGIAGPLLRNLRRFEVLRAALDAIPAELRSVCAPFDVRMAPVSAGSLIPQTGGPALPEAPHVNTLYVYVATATVEALVEQRKRALLSRINAQLSTQLVEDIRCERASGARIEEQLNILAAAPD